MTKKDLATLLNGREYCLEMTFEEEVHATKYGLVVLFGGADDLMEFRGAIHGEVGACGGGKAYFSNAGLLKNECDDDECPHFKKVKESAKTIEAIWDTEGYSFIYKTDIPHETFEIMEHGDTYCRGIVFHIDDLK